MCNGDAMVGDALSALARPLSLSKGRRKVLFACSTACSRCDYEWDTSPCLTSRTTHERAPLPAIMRPLPRRLARFRIAFGSRGEPSRTSFTDVRPSTRCSTSRWRAATTRGFFLSFAIMQIAVRAGMVQRTSDRKHLLKCVVQSLACSEVARWGHRRSCSSMTLAQLAERTAAAGCRGPLGLFDRIGGLLLERGEPLYAEIAQQCASGDFGLASSDAAARWVYRASARQSKEASGSADGFAAADWGDLGSAGRQASSASLSRLAFDDGTRPLTIDLGCGCGVGPLIYASSPGWRGDNVLGCDLGAGGVSYARGLASRWGISGRAKFVRADARAVLRAARASHPEGVSTIVLSCPTPYAAPHLPSPDAGDARPPLQSGNSQLPSSADDPSFLGHAQTFDAIVECLAPDGTVHVASNVEDVALTLLETSQRAGLAPVTKPLHASGDAEARKPAVATPTAAPRRQQRWRESGGARADGACWQVARRGLWASETERTHGLEERPVHRCVLELAR